MYNEILFYLKFELLLTNYLTSDASNDLVNEQNFNTSSLFW